MFKITDSGDIYLTQGDDATIAVNIFENGKPYTMQTGDTLTFAAKQSISSQTAAISVTATENKIALAHTYTSVLQPGLYIYQIQLTKVSGLIYTLQQGNLTITGDVIA